MFKLGDKVRVKQVLIPTAAVSLGQIIRALPEDLELIENDPD